MTPTKKRTAHDLSKSEWVELNRLLNRCSGISDFEELRNTIQAIGHLIGTRPDALKRPLSSLTDAEATECFRVAFGRNPDEFSPFDVNGWYDGKIEVYGYSKTDGTRIDLSIWIDGTMAATGYHSDRRLYSPIWHTTRVVRYLDTLNMGID